MGIPNGDIKLSANFELNVSKPIDSRYRVVDFVDLDLIDFKYDGLIVWVSSLNTHYKLLSDLVTWEEFAGNTDGLASTSWVEQNFIDNTTFSDSTAGIYNSINNISVVYDTTLSDTIQSQGIVVPVGTPVSAIRGMSFTDFIDTFVFPTILPSINTNRSSSLGFTPSLTTVEVGTLIDPVLTATFNKGSIRNGNGSIGVSLVGDPVTFTFTGKGIATNVVVTSSNLVETINTSTPGLTTSVVAFGNNSWSVLINYSTGTGLYYDSKGNPVNNLDGSRVAGTITANSAVIVGRYNSFRHFGYIPTDSVSVRATSLKTLLSATNTGTFSISIPASTPEVWFAVPNGKTATVLYVESSNADVTGSFTTTLLNVNDANGTPVSYKLYSSIIGGGGYPSNATYNITIT